MDNTTSPDEPSPAHELAIVRAALHALVRDMLAGQAVPDHVLHDEQAVVDYYITQARGQELS